MRVFFGLEPDQKTILAISDWRDRQFTAAGRPVPPANFHITLAFIGELDEREIEHLCLSVDTWLTRSLPRGAALTLDRTGYWHKPGIYWLGPTLCPPELLRLAGKLGILSQRVGGKRDRKAFQPHITLFRGCDRAPPPPASPPDFHFIFDHFTLFESRQGRSGVSYHPLTAWEFAGRNGVL